MKHHLLLKFLILALVGALLPVKPAQAKPSGASRARHIILFIGDGMQVEHEIAASQYLYGKEYGLAWHRMGYRTPVSTWDITTYNRFAASMGAPAYDPSSFDPSLGYSPDLGGTRPFPAVLTGWDAYFLRMIGATDSASSATAWATGYKTDVGNIAWLPGDPAGGALKSIAELMRDQNGASIGVVSTVPFSHATPAAHVSHNVSRNNYLAIAAEIINEVQPDVVIGGGHPRWLRRYRYISQADYARLKDGSAGYVFVERQSRVDGAVSLKMMTEAAIQQGGKLFGLFGGSQGNFEPPIPSASPGTPSVKRGSTENPLLEDATLAALELLSRNPNGFFLMLEQGDVDWANHDNSYSRMIGTMWGLNQAVAAAINFVNRPGDDVRWNNTLLLVTSDHGNSYMRLRRERGKPVLGPGELPGRPGSIAIGADGASIYRPADASVFYGTRGHTDELVMLYAKGKGIAGLARRQGTWYPGTQILDNTQLFEAMADAAGVMQED